MADSGDEILQPIQFMFYGDNVIHSFTDFPPGIDVDREAIDKCSICGTTAAGKQIRFVPDRFKVMTSNPRVQMCRMLIPKS